MPEFHVFKVTCDGAGSHKRRELAKFRGVAGLWAWIPRKDQHNPVQNLTRAGQWLPADVWAGSGFTRQLPAGQRVVLSCPFCRYTVQARTDPPANRDRPRPQFNDVRNALVRAGRTSVDLRELGAMLR
ncbi:hypothetical protein [Kocuria rosea]|uniref:hypothetical protein n=1 Tax=Kocuria rosea TaxID=1275 RepID=UPI000D64CCAC|nr:hypothetical protein [Kocuria rosea]PWF88683.1 hypothetical protein DEJ37_06235 [Kocuria rosea]STX02468.1 Uncharacterised protein [Kocuria rosea]